MEGAFVRQAKNRRRIIRTKIYHSAIQSGGRETGLSTHEPNMPGCYKEVSTCRWLPCSKFAGTMPPLFSILMRMYASWPGRPPLTLQQRSPLPLDPGSNTWSADGQSGTMLVPGECDPRHDRLSAYLPGSTKACLMEPFDTAEKTGRSHYRIVKHIVNRAGRLFCNTSNCCLLLLSTEPLDANGLQSHRWRFCYNRRYARSAHGLLISAPMICA